MVDVGMPVPVSFDDPGFDAFLDEVTVILNANPPEPVEEDLSHLVSMPTGTMAAAMLTQVDDTDLSGRNRLAVLQARVRMRSHFHALIYEDVAAVADACEDAVDAELAWEAASSEIRAALRLTRRSADHELDMALSLRDRVPMVLEALKAGDIDHARAATIVRGTSHLPVESAQRVATEIVDVAGRLTTGQLRERLRRKVIDLDPEEAVQRYQRAVEERRVELEATDDATANLLILDAPPDRAAAARRHIDRIARSLRSPHEHRTMDQLRADIALDLLNGENPAAQLATGRTTGGSVNLTVDLTTLTGLTQHSGLLEGFGPVIADIARQIATNQPHSPWRFTITDPDSNQPIATGVTRRRPTAGQHRTVTAHHRTCVFPGCRMPAGDCDIDHRQAWAAQGPTEVDNLAPLCRHDHRIKHEHGWKLEQLDNGDHHWTSPLGRTHTTSGRSP
jgi:hypothetical protein